jgi:hypothetical protein
MPYPLIRAVFRGLSPLALPVVEGRQQNDRAAITRETGRAGHAQGRISPACRTKSLWRLLHILGILARIKQVRRSELSVTAHRVAA